MFDDAALNEQYETLAAYSDPIKAAERTIVGREYELSQLMAAMERPELCNALLIAPAGSGKTALVQELMRKDTGRKYLEIDLSRMIADLRNLEEMASRIKTLFDDAERYAAQEGHGLVLFMDEFHQLVQLSSAAVEGIKPVLAASGARGLRIIAATTNEEFHEHISKNQPLVERLQRISLSPPDRKTTVSILRGMAARYEVADQFHDDHLFELIYEYTERYVPESSQPRKSILVLDAMVGWQRHTSRPMSKDLLADVLKESREVNVAFRVDAVKIQEQLDRKVLNQELATGVVARRLQLCVADLQDKTKPMSSMLFTGSTGVGKTELTKQLSRLLFGDDQRHLIRFDMSEYALDESMDRFREELTMRVWNTQHAVILLDEVEKAASTVTRLLLQVLDDGRLSNRHGRETSFLNSYIILTTNAASEIYSRMASYIEEGASVEDTMKRYMKLIRSSIVETTGDNRFPPELLNRIDVIAPFQPLGLDVQRKIVLVKLQEMAREVKAKHGVTIAVDKKVVQYLVDDLSDTSTDSGGARGIVAKLTDEVTTSIAAYINAHPYEKSLRVEIEGDLVSDHKDMLESDARVRVTSAV